MDTQPLFTTWLMFLQGKCFGICDIAKKRMAHPNTRHGRDTDLWTAQEVLLGVISKLVTNDGPEGVKQKRCCLSFLLDARRAMDNTGAWD